MRRSGDRVTRHAVRTAALAAAVVAAVVAVLCVSMDVIVARALTASVDDRLGQHLARIEQQSRPLFVEPSEDADRDYDQPAVAWRVSSDGTVVDRTPGAPDLPASLRHAGGPVGATLAGTGFRVAGARAGDGILVAAMSTAQVGRAMTTLAVTEAIVGPLLVAAAFAGALLVGRRVAGPVELARRRQLAFTADASHELRTPVAVIQAEASLALGDDPDVERYRTALEHIGAESARMRTMIEDLLWLARFEHEPAAPVAGGVDVAAVARDAAARFGAVAAQRSIRLTADAPGAGRCVIAAPQAWIERLCGVLLDNACRYTPPGGEVTVSVSDDGGRVRLDVADTGPGVPAAERERIFDRFHRATGEPGGAGLGLAVGDAVVRATGGHREVGEGPRGGARFSVWWPRADHVRRPDAEEPRRDASPDARRDTSSGTRDTSPDSPVAAT